MVVKSSLANSDDLAGRPYRIRTCDTLIKRYKNGAVAFRAYPDCFTYLCFFFNAGKLLGEALLLVDI